MSDLPSLPVGLYRLAVDVKNPYADKRVTHDWRRAAVFKAGLPLRIVQGYVDHPTNNEKLFSARREIAPWMGHDHQTFSLREEPAQALLPHLVPETDRVLLLDEQVRQLTNYSLRHNAEQILLDLIEAGDVRAERIVSLVAKREQDERAEFEREKAAGEYHGVDK